MMFEMLFFNYDDFVLHETDIIGIQLFTCQTASLILTEIIDLLFLIAYKHE